MYLVTLSRSLIPARVRQRGRRLDDRSRARNSWRRFAEGRCETEGLDTKSFPMHQALRVVSLALLFPFLLLFILFLFFSFFFLEPPKSVVVRALKNFESAALDR